MGMQNWVCITFVLHLQVLDLQASVEEWQDDTAVDAAMVRDACDRYWNCFDDNKIKVFGINYMSV